MQYQSTLAPGADPYPGFPGPRHVNSIYAEILVPVFGPDNEMPGFHKVDLTLAGRIEDYNQFGRTENPKFSLRWEPVEGIALRGSYGTSFQAPQFDERSEEHTSELQSLMRISYAVFCLKKKKIHTRYN